MKTRGDVTKEKILDAANKLFRKQGFGATSINDLLEETGIKKGSLYFHFPGKDALGLALLEKSRNELMEFLDISLIHDSPGQALENFLSQVTKKHIERGFVGGCVWGNTALEMGDKNNEFTSFTENVFEEWAEKLRKVISDAQDSGEVSSKLPADVLAIYIISAIEGGIMLSRLKKDEKPLLNTISVVRELLHS